MSDFDNHGNRCRGSSPDRFPCDVRKLAADAVTYGTSISRNGRYVMAAYRPGTDELVCIAATAAEVRRKYREIMRDRERRAVAERTQTRQQA